MDDLILEELKDVITLISPVQCDFFSENCIVALENNNKKSGCILSVEGDTNTQFCVVWAANVNKAGYKEVRKIIEHAAEAISFYLCSKLTEFTVIEEAFIGTGIDYWLGYDETHENYDSKNFIRARLEISGINEETNTNSIDSRVKRKRFQTDKSDKTKLPGFISVVEFSTPKAFFGKK